MYYEFTGLLTISVEIEAENEEEARGQIETYSADGWLLSGDVVGVSDIELIATREEGR